MQRKREGPRCKPLLYAYRCILNLLSHFHCTVDVLGPGVQPFFGGTAVPRSFSAGNTGTENGLRPILCPNGKTEQFRARSFWLRIMRAKCELKNRTKRR